MTVWKTYAVHRFVTASLLVAIFTFVFFSYRSQLEAGTTSYRCLHKKSRLLTAESNIALGNYVFYYFCVVQCLAILSCVYVDLLWLGIITYHSMFLFTLFSTLAQGMSGYIENCFNLLNVLIFGQIGMAIALFNLHVLFIYFHRGKTFYQWIPLKAEEFYRFLTERNVHQADHLIQNLPGIRFMKRNYAKVPLLEEDQEDLPPSEIKKEEKLEEKTCIEE